MSNLLNGPTESVCSESKEQASLSIAQLIYFKTRRKHSSAVTTGTRQHKEREPPLPLYLCLKVHTLTRSKDLVTVMYNLGISGSYDRVLQVNDELAVAICELFEGQKLVCPPILRKGLFTVGVLDNIDHNPSATTAIGSFHGTGISIFQYPTVENPGITKRASCS